MLAGATFIGAVVALLLQAYWLPPLAVSVVLPPAQTAIPDGLTAAVGLLLTVTVALAVAVQLFTLVTVTV